MKIGGASDSENDFGTLIERTRDAFQSCERTFIDMHALDRYKVKSKATGQLKLNEKKLQFDLMKNVPSQIEKFFEMQHFDFDNSNNFINSPDPTNLSMSDSSSQQNPLSPAKGLSASPNDGTRSPTGEESKSSSLTRENIEKRDSLICLDEEARLELAE